MICCDLCREWLSVGMMMCGVMYGGDGSVVFFFFQAEDGIRDRFT